MDSEAPSGALGSLLDLVPGGEAPTIAAVMRRYPCHGGALTMTASDGRRERYIYVSDADLAWQLKGSVLATVACREPPRITVIEPPMRPVRGGRRARERRR